MKGYSKNECNFGKKPITQRIHETGHNKNFLAQGNEYWRGPASANQIGHLNQIYTNENT